MSKLGDAVESALFAAGVVSHAWVIVVEEVDEDGESFLAHEISPDLPNWSRLGMLYEAIDMGPYMYAEPSETD